jgi:ribosomal protein S12 methylthiotransferase accessory factor YcaO
VAPRRPGDVLTPRLIALPADKITGIDTFNRLPVVIAHGGEARALGKGLTFEQRQGSALGEWLERHFLYTSPPERYASVRELGTSCIPPSVFGLDLPEERPELVVPYDEDRRVGWVPVRSLTGERRWIHQPGWREPGFYRATSNGAAVGDSEQHALTRAVAELLERHAFVTWWYELEAASPAMSLSSPIWHELTRWFARHDWDLSAHLLPVCAPLPVVLAAAFQDDQAAIIGLGTGTGSASPMESGAISAALEIVQALESFAVLRAARQPVDGDLADFLTPAGASAIRSRLGPAGGQPPRGKPTFRWTSCPLSAAEQARLQIWSSSRPLARGKHFVQVFSPDMLPFPSTGRGRRLNHPILRQRLAASGHGITSVPGLPHPLG